MITRREFLKLLGLGSAVMVMPQALLDVEQPVPEPGGLFAAAVNRPVVLLSG
jgi:hypothetical protein